MFEESDIEDIILSQAVTKMEGMNYGEIPCCSNTTFCPSPVSTVTSSQWSVEERPLALFGVTRKHFSRICTAQASSDHHQDIISRGRLRSDAQKGEVSNVRVAGLGVPGLISKGAGVGPGRPCTVRSNPSWVMVTWDPPWIE